MQRDNPFDPNSDLYIPPQPPLKVMDFRIEAIVADSVSLRWVSPMGAYEYKLYYGNLDWSGVSVEEAELYTSRLPGVKPEGEIQSCWIQLPSEDVYSWSMFSLSKEGLLSAGSDTIIIDSGRWDSPAEISASIRTIRVARWSDPFDDWISLESAAEVNDRDGIDSVSLFVESQWIGSLVLRNGGLAWGREFPDHDLPGESVEALIGHQLSIKAFDQLGFESVSKPLSVARVIDDVPTLVSPAQDTLVAQNPILYWQSYIAEFSFTYSVQIVHISESYVPTTLIQVSGIDPDSTFYQVNEHLTDEQGYLLWTVAVVDEFGNEARSFEARFQVME